jgi:signal transduction histidine kinase
MMPLSDDSQHPLALTNVEPTASRAPPTGHSMKSRNWLELLMPTILVGVAWLSVSGATTFYLLWLDERHEQVLNENVASIRAAAHMQHALWRLEIAAASPGAAAGETDAWARSAPAAVAAFQAALADAESSAFTSEEYPLVLQIGTQFNQYLHELALSREPAMSHDQASRSAVEIMNLCDRLVTVNQYLIELRTADHRRWNARVRAARLLAVVLGPLVGVWLGYRAASRLQRRLAAIRVTLEGATEGSGRVLVEPIKSEGDLDDIDRQVRAVALRLQEALSEAEGARWEAIRNERLAAVGQLAAGVAHELRNPLTSVKLLVQMAAQRAGLDGQRHEPLAVAQDEIARMENTIQSLLDFARPSVAQRVRIDLRAVLLRAVNLVRGRAEQERIDIQIPDEDHALEVICDPEQLHQVFVNLLLNGLDAMPQGGTLTVTLRRLNAAGNDPACEVAVIDQGTGIPPELLEHIFEPFVTTKARGTGLGLAISRRLVAEHGGRLTAANGADRGAVFTVWLPCGAVESSSAESPATMVAQTTEA